MDKQFGQFQNPADVLLDILSAKGNLDHAADLSILLPEEERRYRMKKTPCYEVRHVTKAWTAYVEKTGMGREHMSRASMLPNDIARLQEEVKRLTMIRGARWWSQIVLVHNRAAMQQLRRIDSFVLDLGSSAVAGDFLDLSLLSGLRLRCPLLALDQVISQASSHVSVQTQKAW